MLDKVRLRDIDVLAVYPSILPSSWGEPLPEDLFGATIEAIGMPDENDGEYVWPSLEGGGLIIDYTPKGATETKRIVFAFNETGMWMVYPELNP
jgi:hypothetical protein